MPHPVVAAGAGIAAITLAVAAAVAIYESDEVRRFTDDIRRRIAIAFQAIEDELNPSPRNAQPLFNRPEDAEGFLESRHGAGAVPGVDADEASRKRQREELMYWNAIRESKLMAEQKAAERSAIELSETEKVPATATENSEDRQVTFDEFMKQKEGAEKGTYVINNTGAEVGNREGQGLSRRNIGGGIQGPNPITYANPFADEYHIETEVDPSQPSRALWQDELSESDIYNATPLVMSPHQTAAAPVPLPVVSEVENVPSSEHSFSPATPRTASPGPAASHTTRTMSGTAADDELVEEYMTAGENDNAYSSIQAWAQGTQPDFYSPLPMSPEPPVSEPEVLSTGQLTPTDSMSVVDVANEMETASNAENPNYDVISESDGMLTPASWSEVGSVVSDSEPPMHA